MHKYTNVGSVVRYSLVALTLAAGWLCLLWPGSCCDWMRNVSIKYYPEEVGTCSLHRDRGEREAGPDTETRPVITVIFSKSSFQL